MRLLCLSVLGIAFLCLPAVNSDESDECSIEQFLGPWYVLGIASNCEWMVQYVSKEITTSNVTIQEEGSFTITTTVKMEFGDLEVDMTFRKQNNGTYLHKSEWGDKTIEKGKTDCKTYAITYIRDLNENDGKFCKFVSLYSREISVPFSVKKAFVDFAREKQIDQEQVFLLAREDDATKSA